MLLDPASRERKSLRIEHLHKVTRDIWTQEMGKKFAAVESKKLNEMLEAAKAKVAPQSDLSLPFLRSEWDVVGLV